MTCILASCYISICNLVLGATRIKKNNGCYVHQYRWRLGAQHLQGEGGRNKEQTNPVSTPAFLASLKIRVASNIYLAAECYQRVNSIPFIIHTICPSRNFPHPEFKQEKTYFLHQRTTSYYGVMNGNLSFISNINKH
jgi:hypothetical protein